MLNKVLWGLTLLALIAAIIFSVLAIISASRIGDSSDLPGSRPAGQALGWHDDGDPLLTCADCPPPGAALAQTKERQS